MSKQTPEVILNAIHRRLDDGESYSKIADSIGVASSTVMSWVRKYESLGATHFSKTEQQHYSLEFKQLAVEYYLSGQGSLLTICKKFNIPATSTLEKWIKRYNGHELKASPTGGTIMTKGRKTSFEERIEIVSECLKAGQNYEKTAEKYQVSYQQVYQWVRKYQESGVDGLVDRRGRTKPVSEMSELEKIKAENKILKAQLERKELENIFLKKVDEIERRRS